MLFRLRSTSLWKECAGTAKCQPNFANIKNYAVNGAVHYANALLHHTNYTGIIAIGVTGWRDDSKKLQLTIGVYRVSKDNLSARAKIGDYTDLSFLKQDNFDASMDTVDRPQLTEVRQKWAIACTTTPPSRR
ncbi:hypothetical protein ACGE24_02985 [Corynebacterium kroppenstedtii]|uniref:hypothetical protein n=1 Tax=Corynebacterium sp. PCR 32 TaxID=3351342 RepID=UPI0030A2FE5E